MSNIPIPTIASKGQLNNLLLFSPKKKIIIIYYFWKS